MTYKAVAVRFEIVDGADQVATVGLCHGRVFVKMDTSVDMAEWDELSAAIRVAIVAMELDA
jgi:hypothetical protein